MNAPDIFAKTQADESQPRAHDAFNDGYRIGHEDGYSEGYAAAWAEIGDKIDTARKRLAA